MNKNILVVDDDPAILEVIKIILEDKGYGVVTVSNGLEVEQAVEKQNPHLILLDIWMSGFDGRDIAKKLKAQNATKHIPIIVISAHNETAKIAKEAGADNFLAKPFDIDNLITIVRQYIS